MAAKKEENYKVVRLLKAMIELVVTIKSQSDDNPKMGETLLGKAVVSKADQIYEELQD